MTEIECNLMSDRLDIKMLPGKTLIIGPSRSGKSYFSKELKAAQIHVIDADAETGIVAWYNDLTGENVSRPLKPDSAWLAENHFVIQPQKLDAFLATQKDVILFAHAWNIMDVLDRFDRVAYMFTQPEELERRLAIDRPDHVGGGSPAELAFHRQRHYDRGVEAKKLHIPFIDTTLSVRDFYEQLCKIPMNRGVKHT